ncbi:PWWP domain-containing DNA repair factor 3A-like isoform X2 [Solea solea]|uniref:PWWP domain-containing DNA repair factor 3A-like isoform X2 n=1 Tax=Solea solea TaxID=90069 RepID=UPI0027298C4C|nr:PWWP domain-containing DNA repair factor 3A-like isoform X2 [Solea solea]
MQSLCPICRDTKGQWWSTVERAQQAQQKRREACCLLTSVITEDQGMLQHLKNIITGNTVSPWAKKQDRVILLFEDDEQVDKVMHFLSEVLERTETDKRFADPVAFVMDVLLPEATVYALGAVHSISLDKAKEMYMRGTEFDSSEITQLGEQLQSHISSKARQNLDSFLSNYKKALKSEEFLRRL